MSIPYLKLLDAEGPGQVFEICHPETLIGRKSDSHVVLIDPYISRHHAKIVEEEGSYVLVDLKSTHGSFVNGRRIERNPIRDGDTLRLGRLELLFTTDPNSETSTTALQNKDLEIPLSELSSVFQSPEYEEYSDLEKITWLLDFQYQWGQQFSADRTFQQILKSALRISGAERGFVLVRKEDVFEYAGGMNKEGLILDESNFRTSRSVVRQVAQSGTPVFMTQGIEGELAQQESILEMNLRAVACLPLGGISAEAEDSNILGILYLDSTQDMHTLSGLDQKILDRLATEAGNVFEKLEMLKSFQERKQLEQELAVAYETQKSLLPQSIPQFGPFHIRAFSKPTRYVGGDFYDFVRPDETHLVGILADVSGKGVPAALLSSLLQGALDRECRAGVSLDEVLNRVNPFLVKRSSASRFVTLFVFSLDPGGKGEYVSAGHNPVYLYRAASGEIEELTSENLILGAFEFATYSASPLDLRAGDVLVVYTDGVTEAENPAREMFEEERLLGTIRQHAAQGADTLFDAILEAVESFTEGRAQTDDITFMLIEREGEESSHKRSPVS